MRRGRQATQQKQYADDQALARCLQTEEDEQIAQTLQRMEGMALQSVTPRAQASPAGGAFAGGALASLFGSRPSSTGGELDRRLRVQENMEKALDVNPESFVPVEMLKLNCVINDRPLEALLDTGAQMTGHVIHPSTGHVNGLRTSVRR